MEIVFILVPVSLILVGFALWGFFWAVKSGQFDDLDSPALDIFSESDRLMDNHQQLYVEQSKSDDINNEGGK